MYVLWNFDSILTNCKYNYNYKNKHKYIVGFIYKANSFCNVLRDVQELIAMLENCVYYWVNILIFSYVLIEPPKYVTLKVIFETEIDNYPLTDR